SANVSHELKTPLTSISGFAEIIKSGIAKPEDVPVFAGKIMADVKRLLGLIDDIIRLSRLESGGANEFRICDLGAMAEEVAAQYEFTAEQKNVTLSCDVGHVRIRAVMPFLRDIIANLIDNAIKYNRPEGKVTVSVTQSRSDARLTVKDTGIGIPADCRSRVFERFFRVDKNHSRKIGGTGLGLSIVKHAVEANGGVISLESELGKGTRITVTFPVCNDEKDAPARQASAPAAVSSEAGAKAPGTPVPAPVPSAAAAGAA
ncbi:MAG: ATP-binding protein, partial [Succinivibrionaceae bacterium]|nr:ATP-binding protein [Succinivibrionaceae bacterium]